MRTERGLTLVELAVVLAVLGVVVIALWEFGAQRTRIETERMADEHLRQAEMAVTGFVLGHSRLPCPDTDNDGLEDCGGAAVGTLPMVTIGMPRDAGTPIRYGVYRNGGIALDSVTDQPLMLTALGSPPAAMPGADGQVNGLDFCAALRSASLQPVEASALHIAEQGATPNRRAVAFALAHPGAADRDGSGNLFDGLHTAPATPAFEYPTRSSTSVYDDRVVTMDFDTLWGRMACGEAVAAATHAHSNAAVATRILVQGLKDYEEQLEIREILAQAAVLGATATLASATAGLATATTISFGAVAEALLTQGALSAIIAPAIAAVVANTLTVAAATATLTSAGIQLALIEGYSDRAGAMVGTATALASDIEGNALASSRAGLY